MVPIVLARVPTPAPRRLPAPTTPPRKATTRALLMLSLGTTKLERAREKRFFNAMQLKLERISVRLVTPVVPGFSALNLAAKSKWLRPIAARQRAIVAVWIGPSPGSQLNLHILVLSTKEDQEHRKKVPAGPQAEVTLALKLAEFLRNAGLHPYDKEKWKPRPTRKPSRLRGKPALRPQGRPRTTLPVPDRPPKRSWIKPRWVVLAGLGIQGGLASFSGPTFAGGLTMGLGIRLVQELHLRASVVAMAGPRSSNESAEIMGYSVAPSLALHYAFTLGPVWIGPLMEAQANWSSLTLQVGLGPRQSFFRWRFQGNLGVELTWPAHRHKGLFIATGIGWLPQRETFGRSLDRPPVLTTPHATWWCRIGFRFAIPSGKSRPHLK